MTNYPLLELREVTVRKPLGNHYILQNINLQINRGDRLVIIGHSGAGKTTLLRLLNNLSSPSEGLILLENVKYQDISVINLRREIVLVLQESKLLGMTVKNALEYPLILQKIPAEEINNRVKKWCNKLGILEDWLERNELQLSVGQRQIIAIARGLIMQPKILILDEPTSALDTGKANHLIETLIDLSEREEMTIIMVNHNLEIGQKFANRMIYLEEGQLKEDQSITDINWEKIRENLVKSEQKIREEWD
jgi:D-methionine transport system ATP-binding protein